MRIRDKEFLIWKTFRKQKNSVAGSTRSWLQALYQDPTSSQRFGSETYFLSFYLHNTIFLFKKFNMFSFFYHHHIFNTHYYQHWLKKPFLSSKSCLITKVFLLDTDSDGLIVHFNLHFASDKQSRYQLNALPWILFESSYAIFMHFAVTIITVTIEACMPIYT